eukprot:166196_1
MYTLLLTLTFTFISALGRIRTVNSNSVSQYGFSGPMIPVWNTTLKNITMRNNMYIEYDMILTKDAFDKPSQLDNIFALASNTLGFIDIRNRQMRFEFLGSRYNRYNKPTVVFSERLVIGKLYHINIIQTQSLLKISVNNIIVSNIGARSGIVDHFHTKNQTLYFSNIMNNAANVVVRNFSIITADNELTIQQIQNMKKYNCDIEDINIEYWLKESQISDEGIRYFIDEEKLDGQSIAILIYKEPELKHEFIKRLNAEKQISLQDRLRFEMALNKLIDNGGETDTSIPVIKTVESDDIDSEEKQKVIIDAVVVNDVFEYGFLGPISPKYNNELVNVTIKNNIRIEFDIIISESEFKKPSQIDNIFHIGNDDTHYYPSVFINTAKKDMIFRFTGHNMFHFINVPHYNIQFNILYHIVIERSEGNIKVKVGNRVIYNQKAYLNNTTQLNQTLYFSSPYNNPANVIVSKFTFISSDKIIGNEDIVNAKDFSKYATTAIEPVEDIDACQFGASFEPIQNLIVDYLNIKSNLYLKFYVSFKEDTIQPTYTYNNFDYDWNDSTDSYSYQSSESSEEEEEDSNILNILHIGDSDANLFPSIYFDNKNEIIIFRFGKDGRRNSRNIIESYFQIERKKKYKIEIYLESTNYLEGKKRFQIFVDKENVYDNRFNYYNLPLTFNNQPIFMSNPWQNPANVKISNFNVISSNNKISKADKLRNYPYKYCLLLDGGNDQLNGIWKPNGTFNEHHLFIKDNLPKINHPFLYLFYYLNSWRIYVEPYNVSQILNSPKAFLKCDIDTYDILSCSEKFNFQRNNRWIHSNVSVISGDCDNIGKHTYDELEDDHMAIMEDIFVEFEWRTPQPTMRPTQTPTAAPTSPPLYVEIWKYILSCFRELCISLLALGVWCLVFGVGVWCLVLCTRVKKRKIIDECIDGCVKRKVICAEYIAFEQEKQYQTETFKGEEEADEF